MIIIALIHRLCNGLPGLSAVVTAAILTDLLFFIHSNNESCFSAIMIVGLHSLDAH